MIPHSFLGNRHVLHMVHPEGIPAGADDVQDGVVAFLNRGLDGHRGVADLDVSLT